MKDKMTISDTAVRMIDFYQGDLHDIRHFLKVSAYARVIGLCEKLDETTQAILETAAILHDIACPLCREKYGNMDGRHQEAEGAVLAREFLRHSGLSDGFIERVSYLVGRHHTLTDVQGMDHQILLEADFLVNADEGHYPESKIRSAMEQVFRTPTGIRLLKSVYRID